MGKHDGERFGRLTLVGVDRNRAFCICDCGKPVSVLYSNLLAGMTRSCGCLRRDMMIEKTTAHGESKTRLYRIWKAMRKRCGNSSDHSYHLYGQQGITVCPEWNDYRVFAAWARENGYSDTLTIDRIDPNKGYIPDNCRWATLFEQAINKKNTIYVTIDGVTKPLIVWCREKGVDYGAARHRVKVQHLEGEEVFKYQHRGPNRKPKAEEASVVWP